MSRVALIAILAGVVALVSGPAAWAVPNLQLTFEASENPGADVFYDSVNETSIIEGGGPYFLTAYAKETAFHTNAPGNVAYLSISLDPDVIGQFGDPSTVTVWINGVQVAPPWTWGTPPLDESLMPPEPTGDLAPHGQFPSWNAQVEITIDTPETNLPNVQTGEITGNSGFSTIIEIIIEGNDGVAVHLDLWTPVYDEWGNPIFDEVYTFAPFSHDAEIPPVPEPATAMMLLVGGLVVAGGLRRRRGNQMNALTA